MTEYRGKKTTIVSVGDITERKLAEENLKESEANLLKAQSIARIGNWSWNSEKKELKCSKEIYRILGVTPDQVLEYTDVLRLIHPDDRTLVENDSRVSFSKNIPFNRDFRIIRPDCVERMIHCEIDVIRDRKNGPVIFFGTFQDITERKRAEEAPGEAKAQAELYVDLMGHDINNLNQVGMGFLEPALDTLELDDSGRALIGKSLGALAGSTKLIDNVRKI